MNSQNQNNKTSQFIVMWDMLGLETVINVSAAEQENIVAILKGESIKHTNPIQFMILRAKANPQRYYEIYIVNSELDEVSIRDMFEHSPQVIVDSIRQVGHAIYSDRMSTKRVIV